MTVKDVKHLYGMGTYSLHSKGVNLALKFSLTFAKKQLRARAHELYDGVLIFEAPDVETAMNFVRQSASKHDTRQKP